MRGAMRSLIEGIKYALAFTRESPPGHDPRWFQMAALSQATASGASRGDSVKRHEPFHAGLVTQQTSQVVFTTTCETLIALPQASPAGPIANEV